MDVNAWAPTIAAAAAGPFFKIVFILYVATAFLFTARPELVPRLFSERANWRFESRFQNVVHISHRGGAGEATENTIGAFKRAVDKCRTDCVELDVHMTKDGIPVVVHDRNLLNLTGLDADVAEVDYADIPPIRPVLPVTSQPEGSFFDVSLSDQDEPDLKVPTLEQVLDELPSEVYVNLDVKDSDFELVEKVARVIKKHDRQQSTIWGSSQSQVCHDHLRLSNSNVARFWSQREVLKGILLFWTGLLPFFALNDHVLEPPFPVTFMFPGTDYWCHRADQNWLGRVLTFLFLPKWYFRHLEKRGVVTWVWVVNSDQRFKEAFKNGARGIVTDYPMRLKRYLDSLEEQ